MWQKDVERKRSYIEHRWGDGTRHRVSSKGVKMNSFTEGSCNFWERIHTGEKISSTLFGWFFGSLLYLSSWRLLQMKDMSDRLTTYKLILLFLSWVTNQEWRYLHEPPAVLVLNLTCFNFHRKSYATATLPWVVTTAPIGNPFPMPFAMVTISGTTSWPWKPQKWLPVRPNPVWTCQQTSKPEKKKRSFKSIPDCISA